MPGKRSGIHKRVIAGRCALDFMWTQRICAAKLHPDNQRLKKWVVFTRLDKTKLG